MSETKAPTGLPEFPPRGASRPKEGPLRGLWQNPAGLGDEWTYPAIPRQFSPPGPGILLGTHKAPLAPDGRPLADDKMIGFNDDRHMVLVAGSRAGKSRSVLIPNLLRYKGPCVVIDPKGELREKTAAARAEMGHKIVVLNPFPPPGSKIATQGHNPLLELRQSPNLAADAAQLADALIVPPEHGDAHWTDSAKNLLTGLILLVLHEAGQAGAVPSMVKLRLIVSNEAKVYNALCAMIFDGSPENLVNIGESFLAKYSVNAAGEPEPTNEMRSILSTANEQTRTLDDIRPVFERHDLDLRELAGEAPVTVYLILPAMRIGTHAKWLRLFIYQVLAALENHPRGADKMPLWLVLEEFASLGNIRPIEAAAGYMAGFGVKLISVLQDLGQLQRHYRASWETFLGNAGIIMAFGNADLTTSEFLSKRLGNTIVRDRNQSHLTRQGMESGFDGMQYQNLSVPLLSPSEITYYFSRDTGRQLVLVPEYLPTYIETKTPRIPSK